MGTFKINGELELNSYLTAATNLYVSSANNTSIIFRHGSTEYVRINPSGCLNIGSTQTANTYKLYVAGKTWLSDTLYFNSTASYINASDYTGNAATATKATQDGNGAIISSTYLKLSGGTMTGTIVTPGNDSVVIKPAKNNYDQIGASDCKFWKIHASTFIGDLTGNAATATELTTATAGDSNTPVYFTGGKPVACTSLDLNTTGNAATATKLATARTIALTGSVTGSGTFDGSGNLSIATTTNHSHSYLPLSGGTMTGAILTSFRSSVAMGSYQAAATTVQGLVDEVRYSSGVMGSVNIDTNYAATSGGTIRAGWYNFIYSPHRNGGASGAASGDNHQYGTLILSGMTDNFGTWILRVSGGSIADSRRVWKGGDSVTGAVWNDYAECRQSDCEEAGYVLTENGNDTLSKTTERLQHFAGISSDTWGFSQGETEKAKTPIAVAGRVLAYTYQDRNNYKPGDCVCAAPGGTVDIMTREEVINWPDRIVGTVSCVPDYEEWGGGDRPPVKVNGRIWIKIK